jgi:hypothetical protein
MIVGTWGQQGGSEMRAKAGGGTAMDGEMRRDDVQGDKKRHGQETRGDTYTGDERRYIQDNVLYETTGQQVRDKMMGDEGRC